MAAKIAAALITLGIHLAAGIAVLFIMLVAMNGFSESDAWWGLAAFVGLAALITALMAAAAVLLVHRLKRRDLHGILAVLIAAAISSAIGAALISASGLIGVIAAEIVRRNF